MPAFLNPAEAEMWVGVGLLIFLGIVIFVAKAPAKVAAALDATSLKIQGDLDEAARIREEAEQLLAQLKAERIEAEAQAKDMLASAAEDARRYAAEAKAKLDEALSRRQKMAERNIANAEAQAMAEVKSAAAEMATTLAQDILERRLATAKSDPMIDGAIGQLAAKFN